MDYNTGKIDDMERDIYGRFTSSRREEPKWLSIVTYAAWTAAMWWLFGWAAGVTLIAIAAILFALCVWLSRRDKRADG